MISIARHTDYAARLVLHLAALGDDVQVKISDVAEKRLLPVAFVRRLVGRLVRAGILTATRGAGGGVRLAKPAAEISLLDIVQAMEGGIALNRCVHGGAGCPLAARCPIQCVWNTVNQQLKDSLAAVRFDALARSPQHAFAHHQLQASSSKRPARSVPARPAP
jgi:Rrf2 family protein